MDNKKIILVNDKDEPIGETDVLSAHIDEGKLHRAFTALLINSNKQILMTQRSLKKPLWPTFWDGSFSSHPRVSETLETACIRRCKEELGTNVSAFRSVVSYEYQVRWSSLFSEHEFNHILVGKYDGKVTPDPEEISEYKWLSWDEIEKWSKQEPDIMAPWWLLAVEKLTEEKIF